MMISIGQIHVDSFPTTAASVPVLSSTQEPECNSPRCGPTATPELCPETSLLAG